VGSALGDGGVGVVVDREQREAAGAEAEGLRDSGDGGGVGEVAEQVGYGGRKEEEEVAGGEGGGEVGEVEGDDAVVDEAGEAEDVEVGADQHHVAVAQHPLFGVVAGGAHRRAPRQGIARLVLDQLCIYEARLTYSPVADAWAGPFPPRQVGWVRVAGLSIVCKLVLNTRVICISCWFSFTGTDRCLGVCLKKPALAILQMAVM
jgi:hypothetical protein